MTDQILEAVKALGGDLANVDNELKTSNTKYLSHENNGLYLLFKNKEACDNCICTIDEFNTYAEQWLKEAYMHNAALDCNWDLYYRDGSKLICTSDDIVVHFDVDVCTKQEFIDYCNANCEEVEPEWDGEGLPPIGCECLARVTSEHDFIKCKIEFTNSDVCLVKILDEQVANEFAAIVGVGFAAITTDQRNFKPIKSPRDKAIDEVYRARFNDERYAMHSDEKQDFCDNALFVIGWLQQLTPEQKKEFGL